MDEQEASVIHGAVESLKTLDRHDLTAYLKRGELYRCLKECKPWRKGYNGTSTALQFWASIGLSLSSVEKAIRVNERFSSIIPQNGNILPSRLIRSLVLDPSNDADTIAHSIDGVPDTHFKSYIHERSGSVKPDPETCQHLDIAFYTKCRTCGRLKEQKG